jgi:hypothetical protein
MLLLLRVLMSVRNVKPIILTQSTSISLCHLSTISYKWLQQRIQTTIVIILDGEAFRIRAYQ